jgi:hypothetical protein
MGNTQNRDPASNEDAGSKKENGDGEKYLLETGRIEAHQRPYLDQLLIWLHLTTSTENSEIETDK